MATEDLEKILGPGAPLEMLSDEQRAVLTSLTEHEVKVLTGVKARLEAVGGQVEAQDNNFRAL